MHASVAVKMPSMPSRPTTTTDPYLCVPMISATSSSGMSLVTMKRVLGHHELDGHRIGPCLGARLVEEQIALADDPAQLPVVDHREVTDLVIAHELVGIRDRCRTCDGPRARGHEARNCRHPHDCNVVHRTCPIGVRQLVQVDSSDARPLAWNVRIRSSTRPREAASRRFTAPCDRAASRSAPRSRRCRPRWRARSPRPTAPAGRASACATRPRGT